jgi:RNA polymerase primary sigma factor
MLDQNTFIETVQSVAEIIRTSAEPIGRDEIMSYFKDMELNKAQEDMVFEFLITPHEQENESAGDYEEELEKLLELIKKADVEKNKQDSK